MSRTPRDVPRRLYTLLNMGPLQADLPLVPPFIVFATSSASIVIETNIGPVPICSARTGAKVVIAEGGKHQYILMIGTAECEDPLYSLEIEAVALQSTFDMDRLSVKIFYMLPVVKTKVSLQLPRILNFDIKFDSPLIFLSFRYHVSSRIVPRCLHSVGGEGGKLLDFFRGCGGIEHPSYMSPSPSKILIFIAGFALASITMLLLFRLGRSVYD
ncbi:hypothetical protein CCMSSC00406_0004801 [Pleurotus cornucopiae]|uniref:Uncharacterized protein n=1 Tax=Pleurotus cornucopiae TaxID=5321 RepID=A0ACB7J165_PLECO|nr:hypothetical protein CCMSSC00406_0004801 [Pleurotus cornucopiae]